MTTSLRDLQNLLVSMSFRRRLAVALLVFSAVYFFYPKYEFHFNADQSLVRVNKLTGTITFCYPDLTEHAYKCPIASSWTN